MAGNPVGAVWRIMARALARNAESWEKFGDRAEQLSERADDLTWSDEEVSSEAWAAEAKCLAEMKDRAWARGEISMLFAVDAAIRSTGLVDPQYLPGYDYSETIGVPYAEQMPRVLRLAKEKGVSDAQLAEALGITPERLRALREGSEDQPNV